METFQDIVIRFAVEEADRLGFSTVAEAGRRERGLLYTGVAERLVGETDVVPTLFLIHGLHSAGVDQTVSDAVSQLNLSLRRIRSEVRICSIKKAVSMAYPGDSSLEIDIGELNRNKPGLGTAFCLKATSTLLYRNDDVLIEKMRSTTSALRMIRFTAESLV